MRMSGVVLLGIIAFASLANGQEGEIVIPNNKTQCINDMVQWCNSMQYPQQGAGISMLSITYEDTSAYYRVLCASDSDGTNCTRNKIPWFSCTPDHVLTYKGQILTSNNSSGVDDGICSTADRAFNDLFIQNLSFDNTTLKEEVQKGFEAFFDEIAAMEEQIDLLQKKLNSIPFFRDGFLGGLFDGFLIEAPAATEIVPLDDKLNSTEQANEVKGNK